MDGVPNNLIEESRLMNIDVMCLYHANCSDGTFAAKAVWDEYRTNDVAFIPVNYNPLNKLTPEEALQEILKTPKYKQFKETANDYSGLKLTDLDTVELFIVDFSFPTEHMRYFADVFKRVILLDHHKTARDDVAKDFELITVAENGTEIYNLDQESSSALIFNMNFSGAELTSMYFHNLLSHDDPRSHLDKKTLLVGDRDLWKFEYPETKEYTSGMYFSNYNSFKELEEHTVEGVMELGRVVNRNKLGSIRKLRGTSLMDIEVVIEGTSYKGGIWNNSDASITSEGADYLRNQGYDIIISYYVLKDNVVSMSLRSKEGVNCSIVANHYNGGGHISSAGGNTDMTELCRILTEKRIEV